MNAFGLQSAGVVADYESESEAKDDDDDDEEAQLAAALKQSSANRRRMHDDGDDDDDEDDDAPLELPKGAPPPPSPTAADDNDEIDLDALLRQRTKRPRQSLLRRVRCSSLNAVDGVFFLTACYCQLLAADMEREADLLVQCTRFIVQNRFLQSV